MTDQLLQERKVCTNCGMNAIFNNREYVSMANYGEVTHGDTMHCENCGEEAN